MAGGEIKHNIESLFLIKNVKVNSLYKFSLEYIIIFT